MGSEKEVLVFDFGKTNIRLIHVDTGGEKPQILRFAEVPWDFETPEGQRKDELKSRLAAFGLASAPGAVVTWEEGMVFRQVTLPDMPAEDLKKASRRSHEACRRKKTSLPATCFMLCATDTL